MNIMKKIFLVVIALGLLAAGCSSSYQAPQNEQSSPQSQTPPADDGGY